jgi:hypothetical protein
MIGASGQVRRSSMLRRQGRVTLLVAAGLVHGVSAGAQPATAPGPAVTHLSSADGRYTIAYRWEAVSAREGEFQVLHLSVDRTPAECQQPDLAVKVDAAMPEHGHGLNYHVVVTRETAASFVARGLMFHMAGPWEVYVDVSCGTTSARLVLPVAVM